jgi:hypothetical protein
MNQCRRIPFFLKGALAEKKCCGSGYRLHAPEKVGTEGDEFLFIKYFYL